MKILIAMNKYPDNEGDKASMYVHTRCMCYLQNGIEIDVLKFTADKNYFIDGVRVITLEEYTKRNDHYDLLIMHAATPKSHFKFIKEHGMKFSKFVFFFHGGEVFKVNKVYPKEYPYMKKPLYWNVAIDIRDIYKLIMWRRLISGIYEKSHFVFVSNWMKREFFRWTNVNPSLLEDRVSVIYNCIGESFEKCRYDWGSEKKYDFITIRTNLDGSKYCIDVVTKLAYRNPTLEFLVIGKGRYYDQNQKPENLTWLDKTLGQSEIIDYLNIARFALLPTRVDAQGVMACEIASTGMPLITSAIDVCHEVFDDFKNVMFIQNDNPILPDLSDYSNKSKEAENTISEKYHQRETCKKELDLFQRLCES